MHESNARSTACPTPTQPENKTPRTANQLYWSHTPAPTPPRPGLHKLPFAPLFSIGSSIAAVPLPVVCTYPPVRMPGVWIRPPHTPSPPTPRSFPSLNPPHTSFTAATLLTKLVPLVLRFLSFFFVVASLLHPPQASAPLSRPSPINCQLPFRSHALLARLDVRLHESHVCRTDDCTHSEHIGGCRARQCRHRRRRRRFFFAGRTETAQERARTTDRRPRHSVEQDPELYLAAWSRQGGPQAQAGRLCPGRGAREEFSPSPSAAAAGTRS